MSDTGLAIAAVYHEYLDDCRRLAADLDVIIEDLDHRLSGGEVRYAIDFSEIHAYCEPDDSLRDMTIFHDSDESAARAIQDAVLDALLDGRTKPILLAPHALELQGYIRRLQERSLDHLAQGALRAVKEATTLLDSPEGGAMKALVVRLRAAPEELTETERRALIAYVEKHAPSLLLFVGPPPRSPLQNIQDLIHRRAFDELAAVRRDGVSLTPDTLEPDAQTRERWEKALNAGRKGDRPGASRLDGHAMMLLEAAGRRLADTPTRLCLVTRSRHMHQILAEERHDGIWQGPYLLRHPRSLITALSGRKEEMPERRKRLQELRASLEAFIASAAEGPGERQTADPRLAPLGKLVRLQHANDALSLMAIKERWHSLVSLLSADLWAEGHRAPAAVGRDRDVIVELLRAVHDPGALRNNIRDRIQQLAREIGFTYQYLAAAAQSVVQPPNASILAEEVSASSQAGTITLNASAYYMPYTLMFQSDELTVWSRRVEGTERIDLQELLQLFEASFERDGGSTYEPLLALAYFFAAWDRWPVARDFAELALAVHADDDPPAVEAHFFYALCLRLVDERSPQTKVEAMRSIDTALELLSGGASDPRLLAEKAAQLLYWSEGIPAPRERLAEARVISERALALTGDRSDEDLARTGDRLDRAVLRLRARIYNNLCYYAITSGDEALWAQAEEYLARLVSTLKFVAESRAEWPVNLAETVLWAEWELGSRVADLTERRRLGDDALAKYQDLRKRAFTEGARKTIDGHTQAIEQALSRLREERPTMK